MTKRPPEDDKSKRDPMRPVPIPGERPKTSSDDSSRRKSHAFPFRPSGGSNLTPEGAKRRELARLLWGDDTDEAKKSGMQPVKLDQQSPEESSRMRVRPADSPTSAVSKRISARRACSFPGVLRILLPEISFQPRSYAVRLVDISPHGARLETRQLTGDYAKLLDEEKRFARLEALIPSGKQILSGRIAWVDFRENVSYFGMHFDQEFQGVDELFTRDLHEDSTGGLLNIPPPKLNAFASVTNKRYIIFKGIAFDAQQVEARRGEELFLADVVNEEFSIEVQLHEDRSNFLNIIAIRDGIRSIPTPVCVVHRAGVRDTNTMTRGGLLQGLDVDAEGGYLSLELSGSPRRYFQALRLIEKTLQHADHVELRFDFTGDAEKAEKILRALENE